MTRPDQRPAPGEATPPADCPPRGVVLPALVCLRATAPELPDLARPAAMVRERDRTGRGSAGDLPRPAPAEAVVVLVEVTAAPHPRRRP